MQSQATSKVQKRDKQGQMVVLGVVVYAHVNQHIIMVSTNTSSLLPSATFGVATFKGRLTKKHDLHVGVSFIGRALRNLLGVFGGHKNELPTPREFTLCKAPAFSFLL
jgi:hypothetical protein